MSKDFVFIENGLVKYEDYSRLIDKCEKALKDNRTKDKEIERLNNIRNKAIEYIEKTNFWGIYEDTPMSEVLYGSELLEILRGDKE